MGWDGIIYDDRTESWSCRLMYTEHWQKDLDAYTISECVPQANTVKVSVVKKSITNYYK